jgi:hypothetical protein
MHSTARRTHRVGIPPLRHTLLLLALATVTACSGSDVTAPAEDPLPTPPKPVVITAPVAP